MSILNHITSTKIGIFYKDIKWKDDFFKKLINEANDCKTLCNITENTIFFCDSYINIKIIFLPANESFCGFRLDKIYYQEDIDQDILSMRIRPMLISKIFPLN